MIQGLLLRAVADGLGTGAGSRDGTHEGALVPRQDVALETRIQALQDELQNAEQKIKELQKKELFSLQRASAVAELSSSAGEVHLIAHGLTPKKLCDHIVEREETLQAERSEKDKLQLYMDRTVKELQEKAPVLVGLAKRKSNEHQAWKDQWIRRDDTGDEATLAKFSISGGYTCKSGYNVVMNIAPVSSSGATLTYESEQCSDAYLHPSDNTTDAPLTVTFYPHLGDYKPGTVIVVREHNGTVGQQYVYGYADINFNFDHLNDNNNDVTEMSSCTTEAVSVSDPVETFSEEGEEVSIVFCTGTQGNMVVMNNLNIDYTGADPSPQALPEVLDLLLISAVIVKRFVVLPQCRRGGVLWLNYCSTLEAR
ncbi:hypothetical protein JG688_00015248 [Phytophthora aleatoria]|uniref:Uncharacterized protein n=1 Tax=Phytophthora aleatoria TaxID=2496075 RepID=A0A8J5MDI3_9STRA|nr:hypothetical protein JG688_00015248 [Phytophthora aleatoria]